MKNGKTIVLILVFFLSVGFATVSTTLDIIGNVSLSEIDDFNIMFTDLSIDGEKRIGNIASTRKYIVFTTRHFDSIEERAKLDYKIVNTSKNYDAKVKVVCTSDTNEFIDVQYDPQEMIIKGGNSAQGSSVVKLSEFTTPPSAVVTCTIVAEPIGRTTLGDEYIPSEPDTPTPEQIGLIPLKFYNANGDFIKEMEVPVNENGEYSFTTENCRALSPEQASMTSFTIYIANKWQIPSVAVGNTYENGTVTVNFNQNYGEGYLLNYLDYQAYVYIKAWW